MEDAKQLGPEDFNRKLFENSKALLRPQEVSDLLGVSRETIYDWRYRGKRMGIPEQLFLKSRGKLFIRADILKSWFASEFS
jgi:predicted DNA-binding transcriptional regulator AlpA